MKRFFAILAAGVLLLSCAKETAPQEETKGVPMTFEFSVDGQTKASKTAWTDNDVIYVFFKGLETKHLMLTYDSATEKWTPSVLPGDASLTDEDFDGLTEHTLTAVYFPTPVYVATDSPGQFTITRDGEKPFYGLYLLQEGQAYEIDGTTVKAGLSLEKPADFVQFHIPGLQDATVSYTFNCPLVQPVACASVGVDGTITEDVLEAGTPLSGIFDSDGEIFAGRLTIPGEAADYTFTLTGGDQIYTLLRADRTMESGKQYNFPALTETGDNGWTVTAAKKDVEIQFETSLWAMRVGDAAGIIAKVVEKDGDGTDLNLPLTWEADPAGIINMQTSETGLNNLITISGASPGTTMVTVSFAGDENYNATTTTFEFTVFSY